jgi:hypothetical protein
VAAWGAFLAETFAEQRKRITRAKSIVETDGDVEKPKNGFPTSP